MTDAAPRPSAPVASQRIADTLAQRILSGDLAPGTRIIQDDIADELSASRLPVREALRILEARGLVTLKTNSGAWVARMELRDCELTYTIRERLEPLLLAESLPHFTAEDVDELIRIQDEIESTDDVERFIVLDRRLHWLTYRHHQADHLVTITERLWDTTQHYRRAFASLSGKDGAWVIDAEHRLLIEAIRDGDVDAAGTILALHIRRTRIKLAQHPELFET